MAAVIITSPLVTPSVPQRIYTELWIRHFEVNAPDCNGGPATLSATFGLIYRDPETGFGVFHPDFAPTLKLPNIFATADTQPDFGDLLMAVEGELIAQAVQSGLFMIAEPPLPDDIISSSSSSSV